MTKYKHRYILGKGYLYDVDNGIGLIRGKDNMGAIKLKLPKWIEDDIKDKEPKYKLVLERIK